MKMKTVVETILKNIYVQLVPRTSAVADSMTDYLGNLEGAIVTNATNFYGDDNKIDT